MTVAEFIKRLNLIDQSREVLFECMEEGLCTSVSIRDEPTCNEDERICRIYIQQE